MIKMMMVIIIITIIIVVAVVITESVLRQVNNLFQSELSRECNLVPPLSVSGIFAFP
jgi:hypothetical protein